MYDNPISATWTNDKYKDGFVAWAASAFIVITSLPVVRRRFFEAFLYSHFAFLVFFIFAYKHTSDFFAYLVAAVVVYFVDKAIRVVWGLLPKTTNDVDVSHEEIVKLTFPKGKLSQQMGRYKPGQYVRKHSFILVFCKCNLYPSLHFSVSHCST